MTDPRDPFDDLLKGWLRERGRVDDGALREMAGHVAALPPRRRGSSPWPAIAAGLGAILLGGLVLSRLPLGAGSTGPQPPDPAAFAGDPRMDRCGAGIAPVEAAFEAVHASDIRFHLPAMLESPELDVPDPAFVVVFADGHPFGVSGGAGPRTTNAPGHKDVCVLVGADPETATLNVYTDVDASGLIADLHVLAPTLPPPTGLGRFADDPRVDACGARDEMDYVFEIPRATDLDRYLPNAPVDSLEPGEPALVAIYRENSSVRGLGGGNSRSGAPSPAPVTPLPGTRWICVSVEGATSFRTVDITGLTLDPGRIPVETGPVGPSPTPVPTPTPLLDDPRLAACGGDAGTILRTEEIAFGDLVLRVYSGFSPDGSLVGRLEPAYLVIYHGSPPTEQADPTPIYAGPTDTPLEEGHHGVCVVLGEDSATWEVLRYEWAYLGDRRPPPSIDDSEQPLGAWTTTTGSPLVASQVEQREDCYGGTKLLVDGRLYVWDPDLGTSAYDPSRIRGPFDDHAALPADATATFYRSGRWLLYLEPAGTAAWLVTPGRVQRWPHVPGDDYQRTDCN